MYKEANLYIFNTDTSIINKNLLNLVKQENLSVLYKYSKITLQLIPSFLNNSHKFS